MFKKSNNELDSTVDEMEFIEDSYAPDELLETYKPVNQLFVPEAAKEKFRAQGFDLQWVRIYQPNSNGQMDFKNIQKKENDMYQFVLKSEIPGIKKAMTGFFTDQLTDNINGLYIVGDLALAKFPLARKEAKKQYNENKTKARSKALIDDLKKNRLMPDVNAGEKFETTREQPKGREVSFGN